MIPPSGEQITITAGDQQAVVVEVGGGLRSYSVGGRELVDGYRADEMSSSGRGQVLIPWPNRLQDGSYEFDGWRHQLPLNEPERRNAIHGLVRWATWTAAEREPHRAVILGDPSCNPTSAGFPSLREGTEYDFQQPRRIGSTRLDHAFTDLKRDQDGLARVELQDPDRGMQVSLWVDQSYPYFMIFSGDSLPNFNRRSLAVEPMTCPPNAFRTGGALIRLEPGSSLTSTWGIARGSVHGPAGAGSTAAPA